jgi:hypothetical protein
MDREDASSRDSKCVYNCYVEYTKIKKFLQECGDDRDWGLFYLKAAYSVLGEYSKMTDDKKNLEYSSLSQEYYTWFRNELSDGIKKEILTEERFCKKDWNYLNLFIHELDAFIKEKNEEKWRMLHCFEQSVNFMRAFHEIVVFGNGQRGKRALVELDKAGIRPAAIVDNNEALWGGFYGGIEILGLNECMERFRDACYLVENELHAGEIRQQLLAAGIQEEKICLNMIFRTENKGGNVHDKNI